MDYSVFLHLVRRYELDCPEDVRYIDDLDYRKGAIECNGQMPYSTKSGWFFAGYETEIRRESSE
jgi:hypothetical protein